MLDWYCAAAVHESFLADLDVGRAGAWQGPRGEVRPFAELDGGAPGVKWSINAFALTAADLHRAADPRLAELLLRGDELALTAPSPPPLSI
eukprot:gene56511-48053_t